MGWAASAAADVNYVLRPGWRAQSRSGPGRLR